MYSKYSRKTKSSWKQACFEKSRMGMVQGTSWNEKNHQVDVVGAHLGGDLDIHPSSGRIKIKGKEGWYWKLKKTLWAQAGWAAVEGETWCSHGKTRIWKKPGRWLSVHPEGNRTSRIAGLGIREYYYVDDVTAAGKSWNLVSWLEPARFGQGRGQFWVVFIT